MSDLSKMLDCLKSKTEEVFEAYSTKEKWDSSDLKCAKEAAELYDLVQNIQMNTGIWENMKRTGDYSFARYPKISYGDDSYARGRDAAGRYTSHGDVYRDDRYHDGHMGSYGDQRYLYNGHSMHSVKDQAIQKLEALMDTAESEYERNQICDMIKSIEMKER